MSFFLHLEQNHNNAHHTKTSLFFNTDRTSSLLNPTLGLSYRNNVAMIYHTNNITFVSYVDDTAKSMRTPRKKTTKLEHRFIVTMLVLLSCLFVECHKEKVGVKFVSPESTVIYILTCAVSIIFVSQDGPDSKGQVHHDRQHWAPGHTLNLEVEARSRGQFPPPSRY